MTYKENDVIITSAVRTAIGTISGSLKDTHSYDLGSKVIKESLVRSKLKNIDVDEVVLGQVLTGGTGQNPARQAAVKANLPTNRTAYVINQVCGSGLRSIAAGYQAIISKDSNIIIAGGQESMSRAPYVTDIRNRKKFKEKNLVDSMIKDGLWDAFNDYHMGVTAENVAKKWKISRKEQDQFSFESQQKTKKAQDRNRFKDEIIPITIRLNNKKFIFKKDEHPRNDVSIETLERLKPVFKKNGTVTAGNSSGINDGAAAVVLMTYSESEKRSLVPLAKIVSWATCGVDPSLMGSGPIPASKLALKKAGWSIKDIDLIEVNEAFAAQSLAVIKELGLPKEKVNVNGGAIALGHPIGASGTRILVTMLYEMNKRDVKKGLATLCIGGGMGIAMCVER